MDVIQNTTSQNNPIWPGGGREWDWRETDTHHLPGIQPADIKELLERDSQTIVRPIVSSSITPCEITNYPVVTYEFDLKGGVIGVVGLLKPTTGPMGVPVASLTTKDGATKTPCAIAD